MSFDIKITLERGWFSDRWKATIYDNEYPLAFGVPEYGNTRQAALDKAVRTIDVIKAKRELEKPGRGDWVDVE